MSQNDWDIRLPERTLILRLERKCGKANTWHGRCHEIAIALLALLPDGFRETYGHYHGPINPLGYWGDRAGLPVIQHGWVVTPDGRVLDPTRWSFEAKKVYIYLGQAGSEYDEGGMAHRAMTMHPYPRDDEGNNDVHFDVSIECLTHMTEIAGTAMLDRQTARQAAWFANAPIQVLEPFAYEIFQAIVDAGHKAFIPVDSYRMVFDDFIRS
jgi:hypothetical protein